MRACPLPMAAGRSLAGSPTARCCVALRTVPLPRATLQAAHALRFKPFLYLYSQHGNVSKNQF